MPFYRYKSFNRDGKEVEGKVDASSIEAAKNKLKGQGLIPVLVEEASKSSSFW